MADLVLDNTLLFEAARALEREAAVLEDHCIEDLDAAPMLREAAVQLRAVALAAKTGAAGDPVPAGLRWPTITVRVQGVADESMWPAAVRSGDAILVPRDVLEQLLDRPIDDAWRTINHLLGADRG